MSDPDSPSPHAPARAPARRARRGARSRRPRPPSSPAACPRTSCSARKGCSRSRRTPICCSRRSAWRSAATRPHWPCGSARAQRIAEGCRVHVPRGLARELVRRSAPRQFTQHARNPARSVEIGGAHTVFAPAYGPPFVTDIERGRRYGTLADFENFVKLTYLAPWLHHSGGTVCEPVDVPVNKRHFDMVYAHIRYSDKPFMGSVTTAARAADSIELCRVLFGAAVRRRSLRDPRQRERQLPAGARRGGEPRDPHLRGREPGRRVRAVHPRRRHGTGDDRRRTRPVLRRGAVLRGADAAGAARAPR